MITKISQTRIEFCLDGKEEAEFLKNQINIEYLAKRISQLVDGDKSLPYWDNASQKWQLDTANNWWLTIKPEGILTISHRYGKSAELLSALVTVIRLIIL